MSSIYQFILILGNFFLFQMTVTMSLPTQQNYPIVPWFSSVEFGVDGPKWRYDLEEIQHNLAIFLDSMFVPSLLFLRSDQNSH